MPPDTHTGAGFSRWDHWYRRAFPSYGVFLFCINHLPGLRLPRVPGNDKIAHACAFALLTFLCWRFAQTFDRRLTAGFAAGSTLLLLLYAAMDEWTQQFVYRGTDFMDFLADAGGILLMAGTFEVVRRRREGASLK